LTASASNRQDPARAARDPTGTPLPTAQSPEIPENPMMNMRPNTLIYGARYDKVMEAFGGKGFFVEDPRALDEAMNHRGPAFVNIVLSQGSARKPQRFHWHS
jgi:2-hydroxyacyl-CoA lyase 1